MSSCHVKRLWALLRRLRAQAFRARQASGNPLAERQAADLQADAAALAWALAALERRSAGEGAGAEPRPRAGA